MNTFDIKMIEEHGILRFTLTGPGTYAHLLRAVAAIVAETKSREIWHVLCDATAMTTPAGAFEKFEAGVELARGAAVAVFGNEGAALQWLLGSKTGA
jgi:hypothetical protein